MVTRNEKVVKLHLSDGRNKLSLEKEFNLSKGCVSNWVKIYRKECESNGSKQVELDYFTENLRLKKEVLALQKEKALIQENYPKNIMFHTD